MYDRGFGRSVRKSNIRLMEVYFERAESSKTWFVCQYGEGVPRPDGRLGSSLHRRGDAHGGQVPAGTPRRLLLRLPGRLLRHHLPAQGAARDGQGYVIARGRAAVKVNSVINNTMHIIAI